METNKVNNKTWDGSDSAFLRCISSKNKSFYDIPIAYGSDANLYDDLCKCASVFVVSLTSLNGYLPFDYWMRFNVKNGKIISTSNDGWCLSGVCGVDSLYFKGDINTLELHGIAITRINKHRYDVLDISKMDIVKNKDEFISDYNMAISRVGDELRISDEYLEMMSK